VNSAKVNPGHDCIILVYSHHYWAVHEKREREKN
jgi:hypothetical protein